MSKKYLNVDVNVNCFWKYGNCLIASKSKNNCLKDLIKIGKYYFESYGSNFKSWKSFWEVLLLRLKGKIKKY